MLHNRLTATNVAILIVLNSFRYGEEKQKVVSRYKLTKKSFKILARRKSLHLSFVAEVSQELQELGWQLIEDGDGNFCFFDLDMTTNWARLSVKRVSELRDQDEEANLEILSEWLTGEYVDDSND